MTAVVQARGLVIAVAVLAVACRPNSEEAPTEAAPSPSPTEQVHQAPGVSRDGCRGTLNASVRGATGSFPSPEDAARSVPALPADGSLVELERDESTASFAWSTDGRVEFIVDVRRGDDGWSVGFYERCAAPPQTLTQERNAHLLGLIGQTSCRRLGGDHDWMNASQVVQVERGATVSVFVYPIQTAGMGDVTFHQETIEEVGELGVELGQRSDGQAAAQFVCGEVRFQFHAGEEAAVREVALVLASRATCPYEPPAIAP